MDLNGLLLYLFVWVINFFKKLKFTKFIKALYYTIIHTCASNGVKLYAALLCITNLPSTK
jgi:hypothetical protein